MRAIVAALCLLVIGGVQSIAAKPDFQAGRLVSITADETLVKGTTHRQAIFTVQIGDLIVTARGENIGRHPGDLGHGLIVGDMVRAAIDRGDLIVLKPDGKELKTKIIKRERAQ